MSTPIWLAATMNADTELRPDGILQMGASSSTGMISPSDVADGVTASSSGNVTRPAVDAASPTPTPMATAVRYPRTDRSRVVPPSCRRLSPWEVE